MNFSPLAAINTTTLAMEKVAIPVAVFALILAVHGYLGAPINGEKP